MLFARTIYAWLPAACVLVALLTSCSSPQSTRHPPAPAHTLPGDRAGAPVATATTSDPAPRVPATPVAVPPAAPTRPTFDPAAAPVVEKLAAQLLLAPEAIVVVSVEAVQWPDACLGLPAEGENCASMLTPGYAVTLSVGIDTFVFRTDVSGEKIRVASAPPARAGEPLVTWRDTQSFNMMIIGTQRVAIGRRGRPLIAAPLAVPARASELQDLLARYAPFQAKTPAGEIALRGVGATRASETEQRMIAEWARLISHEARAGGEQPEADSALVWKQANGASDAFDQIEVTRTGRAIATHIRGGQATVMAGIALRAEELATFYGWLDRFEAFEVKRALPADGGLEVAFRGTGDDEADEAVRAAVLAWIDAIALRLREAALK